MRAKQKIINLYNDNSVDNIKHVISISNEEDLNKFWHYFHSQTVYDHRFLYGFISLLYAFGTKAFEKEKALFFELIIEQNEECFYFTVWNAEVSKALSALLDERDQNFEYKVDKKRMTIKLVKELISEHNQQYKQKQEDRREGLILSLLAKKPQDLVPYTFLTDEDREELVNLCEDMSDIMYRAKDVGFVSDALIRLRSCLGMFSLSLRSYPQVTHICNLITEFSVLLNRHHAFFEQMSPEEIALIEGFISNLERWNETLFIKGGADLHFMDSSLKADLQMIKMLIDPQETQVCLEVDDIFEF